GIETSGRLQFQVRESRTSGPSAQAQTVFKMADQKEKNYEALKVFETVSGQEQRCVSDGESLIYQLFPPVLNLWKIVREKVYCGSYFTVKCTDLRSQNYQHFTQLYVCTRDDG
ncbi:hypothetical protein ACROYT_G043013, partial [Oculina patagonica]